jgi:alpha-mannosidase
VYVEDVPANGYRAFSTGAPAAPAATMHISMTRLETPFWRIELDGRGRISRLWDRTRERDVLPDGRVGNRLVVFEDKPLQWDAWDIDVFHLTKALDVDDLQNARVLEQGPERGMLELTWRFGAATRIVQRLTVYARVPRIDFLTRVDWQARQSLLKVGFPTRVRNRRATYEIQFGTIDRPTHTNTSWEEAAFEVPAQRFVDLSDAHAGVAVLAFGKHGYSVREGTLWLSLLKGAVDPDPEADRGEQVFSYSLLPHGPGLEDVRRAAYAISRPLLWRRETAHAGSLPACWSLAQATQPGVLVETAKYAEDEETLILRLYEAEGGATRTRLELGVPGSIDELNLLERNPRPLAETFELRAREVKTVRVRPR